jgi:hypothetical protein
MSNTHNPPAFPVSVPGHVYGDGSSELPYVEQEGMTLRDYFAAKALQGFCGQYGNADPGAQIAIAARCYALADAMLSARATTPNP